MKACWPLQTALHVKLHDQDMSVEGGENISRMLCLECMAWYGAMKLHSAYAISRRCREDAFALQSQYHRLVQAMTPADWSDHEELWTDIQARRRAT